MKQSIRIGTWNLQCAVGELSNAHRLSAIREVDADIWILTETHDEVVLGADFHAVRSEPADISVAPKQLREGSRWTTIWTRFPLLEELPVSDPQRSAAALLGTPFGLLVVYGTVLPWPASKPSFREAVAAQGADWAELRKAHPDAAFCIAGDLNADMIEGKGFPGKIGIVALREAMAACGVYCSTLPAPNGPPRIDHVLLCREWHNKSRVVGTLAGKAPDGVQLSDHDGVIVEVLL